MAYPSAEELTTAIKELRGNKNIKVLAHVASRAVLDAAEKGMSLREVETNLAKRLVEQAELSEDERKTSAGDPYEILEKGPQDSREAATAAALFALGIVHRLDEIDETAKLQEFISKMLPQLDWLAVTTALMPYEALALTLEDKKAEFFWNRVAADLVRESTSAEPENPTEAARRRTRLLIRASVLSLAPENVKADLASSVLPDVKKTDILRVACAALTDVGATGKESVAKADHVPKLEGNLVGASWGLLARLIAAVTGILLLRWLAILLGQTLLGYKRAGTVALNARTINIEHKFHILGRTALEGKTSYALNSLRSGGIEKRFRYLHLLVGALALVMGVGLGVNFFVEGTCSSYPPLALFGIAVIGGGILLDVLLEVLIPNKKGVCTLQLDFGPGKNIRLRGVNQELATQFVKKLEHLVPTPKAR